MTDETHANFGPTAPIIRVPGLPGTAARTLLLCFMFLLWALPLRAAAPLVLCPADSYPLGGATLELLEDPDRSLTIADVSSPRFADRFVPVHQEIPNFGLTDAAFWFRFTVDPGQRGGERWLLLLDQPLMNNADLYVPRGDGGFDVERSGDHVPMSRRDVRKKDILLSLPLVVSPRTFYLRTWIAGRAQVLLTVLTREAYQKRESAQNFFFGAYGGFMLVMVFLGLSLFALLRDRTYLLYAAYVTGIMLVQFTMRGYLYGYVLPEHPRLHDDVVLIFCTLTILAALLFARRFLRLSEYSPQLYRLFGWLAWLNLLMVVLCHFTPALAYKKLIIIDLALSGPLGLLGACISYRKGFVPARYYIYGRISLSVGGGFVYPLVSIGYLPVNLLTTNILLIASVLDIFFIVLAMGYHFYAMSRQVGSLVADLEREVDERTAAHRALKEQMEEKRRLELEVRQVSGEERRRISHELHDGLCQQLTGANLRFAALEDQLAEAGLLAELRPLGALLQNSVDHAYALSRRLWTSDEAGSEGVIDLDELVRLFSGQSAIPIRVDVARGCPACSSANLLHIHLIAREALVNAVKHSGATLITVTLHCTPGEGILLEVRDNGRGISKSKGTGGGLGIGMMEYRATRIGGRIVIAEAEGGGTCVVCDAPCTGTAAGEVTGG